MTNPVSTQNGLREQALTAYRDLKRAGWDLAVYCHRITIERTYTAWGFASASAWANTDLPSVARNLSHFCALGRHLQSLPESDRAQWTKFPVWNVLAGGKLLTADPPKLLAALESGATQSQVRQLAAAALPDEHRDSEYRTIHLRVSASVYEQWERALHRAGYEACQVHPTPDHLIECIAMALLNEPLWQIPNGIEASVWTECVHTGQVKCRECGSLDRTRLTWHHIVPRSHQGHESLQVPLCLECHEKIQPRWREWLTEQNLEEEP